MPIFNAGDVVKVPFPYVEKPVRQFRPALVISSPELQELHGLLWVLMITSARNRPWAGDVPTGHLEETGLPVPSVVRCAKIATIETSEAALIGKLADPQWNLVKTMVNRAVQV